MSNSLGDGCDRVPNQSCGEPRSTVYQGLIMQHCPVSRTTSQRRLKQTLSGCFRVIFKLLAASAETGVSRFDDEFPHQYSVRKQRAQKSKTMKSVFTLTSDLSHTSEGLLGRRMRVGRPVAAPPTSKTEQLKQHLEQPEQGLSVQAV